MGDLLAARSQMAMSLAFHIVFAVIGIGMPLLMVICEALWLRTGHEVYRTLARRWAKGTAILFAVGAVSGTVLSFELGLLWPKFMELAGPIIGMPFSLEGFAFFLEAIFLGIYLYGWDKVGPRLHLAAGVMVCLSGMCSGIFVIAANAWMNAPTGFVITDGVVSAIDPWAAMFNDAFPHMALHMTLASFLSVGFAVAAVHAIELLKNPHNDFHRKGFAIAAAVGAVMALLMPLSGDRSAKYVATAQPIKFAAMEALWHSAERAPFTILGFPDEKTQTTHFGIEVPGVLSFLAHGDFGARVQGLETVPEDEWPPIAGVHIAFQLMIGCGMAMLGMALLGLFLAWRHKAWPRQRWYLWLVVLCGPLGFVAVEAGWFVTELGRQPWVIYGLMRTEDAVTDVPQLVVPFLTFSFLYLVLGWVVIVMMRRHVFASPDLPAQGEGEPHEIDGDAA